MERDQRNGRLLMRKEVFGESADLQGVGAHVLGVKIDHEGRHGEYLVALLEALRLAGGDGADALVNGETECHRIVVRVVLQIKHGHVAAAYGSERGLDQYGAFLGGVHIRDVDVDQFYSSVADDLRSFH